MEMEINVGKYPVLKEKIYKNPHGGTIICKRTDIPTDHSIPPVWGNLNEFGVKFLLECTGEKTVREIINQLYGEESDKAQDPILEFLRNTSLKFNMEFLDSPSPQKVKSYGTFECYYPMRILAEVTTRCNLHCRHCSISAGTSGEDMRKEDLFRIVDMLSEEGALNFDISGGEPFLRKDILDIVEKCCNTFYDVVIATNGTLIGREEAKNLAQFTNVQVHVSLDGHTAQLHDKFRGVEGTFDKALSGIRNLVSEGIYTRMGTTITKDSFNNIEKILHLADELGVKGINYDTVREVGRGEATAEEAKKVMSWIKKMEEIARKREDVAFLVYERARREFTLRDCGAGTTMWTVGPTGNVRPCATLGEKYLVCGNLLKEDFHRIFSRDPASIFSKTKSPCKEMCEGCKYVPHCNGCLCNGVVMYKKLKEKCKWGVKAKVGDWVTLN